MDSLREISKTLTEPSKSPSEPPVHRYTLRGVCTQPHVIYVLSNPKQAAPGHLMDLDSNIEKGGEYEWWRISFSREDGKTQRDEKRKGSDNYAGSANEDVIGYTVRKVQELEVLQAAREEGSSALLVYASENAMNAQVDPAPPQLQVRGIIPHQAILDYPSNRKQGFVNRDNDAFGDEFENTPTIIFSDHEDSWGEPHSKETPVKEQQPDVSTKPSQVNVFDYEVSAFDDEQKPSQEMQERGGTSLLGATTTKSTAPTTSQAGSSWNDAADEDMTNHIEHAE